MPGRAPIIAAAASLGLAAVFWWSCSTGDLDRSIPLSPGGSLSVDVELGSGFSFDHGSLVVTSHSGEEVRVVVDVSGWGGYAVDLDTRERAREVDVVVRVEGFLHWAFGGPTVDVRVEVPRTTTLAARIDGGPLRLEDLVGPLTARVRESDVTLRRAEGDVRLAANGGDVHVEDVEGELVVEGRHAGIDVSGVSGRLSVHTERGSIQIASVKGPVEATSTGGSIRLERIRGDVRAATERGRIEAEDVAGGVEVETERGNIEILELDGAVRARSARGEIVVEFVGDPSGVIEAGRGSIDVEVPEQAGFDLVARTARGDVALDGSLDVEPFPETPDVSAAPAPRTYSHERAVEIAAEIHDRVRENVERGLREGNWSELDWDFDWSWEERDPGARNGDGTAPQPRRRDWGLRDRDWDWGDRRRRGDEVAGAVNGGGKELHLSAKRGSISVAGR